MIDQELISKADTGDIDAILALANAYYDDDYEYGKCLELYQKVLAEQPSNGFVLNRIGICFNNGYGCKVDVDKANDYYRKAADLGEGAACYNLADNLFKAKDPDCLPMYEKAFQLGDADAPLDIAELYLDGSIVPQSIPLALEYYDKAISLGNANAKLNLACEYLKGDTLPLDEKKGLELLLQAADEGSGKAANNISIMFEQGNVVEKDIEKSLEWAKKAAALGVTEQLFSYGIAYYNGSKLVAEDKQKAFDLFTEAAEAGDLDAAENLGICLAYGYGVDKDIVKAAGWFEKSARKCFNKSIRNLKRLYPEIYGQEAGNQKYIELLQYLADKEGYFLAMVMLYSCYSQGDGVEKDMDIALRYLDRAVAGEYESACLQKALLLLDGKDGVEKDEKEAVRLFTIAANDGNILAASNLGICYRDGKGVPADINEAVQWMKKAAEGDDTASLLALGTMFLDGSHGLSVDRTQAGYYLEKLVGAQTFNIVHELGVYYMLGAGGFELDKDKAVFCWQCGANAGDAECMKSLGICYRDGDGVSQDHNAALEWFNKAAALGNADAMVMLGRAHDDGGFSTLDYEVAFDYYSEAYAAESAEGALLLGRLYDQGKGVEKDRAKAFTLNKYAAERGNSRAMVLLGLSYAEGEVTDKDVDSASMWLEKAKGLGETSADDVMALVYSDPTVDKIDPQKAFEFNKRRAEAGDAAAQFELYSAYMDGNGVAKNGDEAIKWLKLSADNGNPIGQAVMGLFYKFEGDFVNAVKYFEKVDDTNDAAMSELGDILLDGAPGVPVDKARAIELYKKAAEMGNANAQSSLGICYATGNGVEEDQHIAYDLFEKAAMQGQPDAQKNLGVLLNEGAGIARNVPKAVEWFEKAAEQGNLQAMNNLAVIYRSGAGVPTDFGKAEKWYLRLIDTGDEDYLNKALFNLAYMYAEMTHEPYKAVPLWKRAAERGDSTSQFNLGLLYHKGEGVEKDDDQALFWWRKAADQGDADAQKNINIIMQSRTGNESSPQPDSSGSGRSCGGCYVATAVYGSYDCPEVWTLRRYRDYRLFESWYGRVFIRAYYAVSPTLVKVFGGKEWFTTFWKAILDSFVRKLQARGYEDTQYEDRRI